jgi:hypothetical protein
MIQWKWQIGLFQNFLSPADSFSSRAVRGFLFWISHPMVRHRIGVGLDPSCSSMNSLGQWPGSNN